MGFFDWFHHKENVALLMSSFLVLRALLLGIRDGIDKTPETDDNAFERFVTIIKLAGAYFLMGQRPTKISPTNDITSEKVIDKVADKVIEKIEDKK